MSNLSNEFDVSNVAWEVYELMYDRNIDWINDISNVNNRQCIETEFSYKHKTSVKSISFSGETDFNFSPGFGYSRSAKFGKIIAKDGKDDGLLLKCESMMYSVANISLMPQSGALQLVKKGIGNDRLDTFIWALDAYYRQELTLLFNFSSYDNLDTLKKFLDLFGNVYEYCATVYHINKHLVNALIKSGKKPLTDEEEIINYMKLAQRFWRQKLKYINGKIEKLNDAKNKMSDELRRKLEEASKILDC